MAEIETKCYQCGTPLPSFPPYFCDDKCKNLYWHESAIGKQKQKSRPIAEIQSLFLQKARTSPHEEEPADFMAHIVTRPIQPESLPYRDN